MIDISLLELDEINIKQNNYLPENTVVHLYFDDFDFSYAHNSYYVCFLKISYKLKDNKFINLDSLLKYLKCYQKINLGKNINDASEKIQRFITTDISTILNINVSVSLTNIKEQYIYLNNYSNLESEISLDECVYYKFDGDFTQYKDYKYEQYKLKTNLIKHKYKSIDMYSNLWIRFINGNMFNIEDLYHYINTNKNNDVHPLIYTINIFNKLNKATECEKINLFSLYNMNNKINLLICCETPKGQFTKKYINEYLRIKTKWD